MNKSIFIFFILLSISCSQIKIKSSTQSKVSFKKEINAKENILIIKDKDYFLWGLIPTHELDIGKVLVNKGYTNISSLEISSERNLKNTVLTFLTFGVYCPETYIIKGNTNI